MAWDERRAAAPGEPKEANDELDGLHTGLTAEIASGAMPAPVVIEMALVPRYCERLADHFVTAAQRTDAQRTDAIVGWTISS